MMIAGIGVLARVDLVHGAGSKEISYAYTVSLFKYRVWQSKRRWILLFPQRVFFQ